MPNGGDGVEIRDSEINVIGGTAPGDGNVISGNEGDGVEVGTLNRDTADGNLIAANQIGTNAAGTLGLGNGDSGVYVDDASHTQVGNEDGANTIAFNGDDGVTVVGGEGNGIEDNSVFSNGGLGIDLGINNVTDNDEDPLDPDTGANGLQNFPVVQSASRTAGMTTIDWTRDSLADTTFDVQFYGSVACDASGHGEGQTLLHTARVTTDADGHVPGVLITDHFGGLSLTMTATVVSHFPIDIPVGLPARGLEVAPESTSEFSPCAQLPIVIEPRQLKG